MMRATMVITMMRVLAMARLMRTKMHMQAAKGMGHFNSAGDDGSLDGQITATATIMMTMVVMIITTTTMTTTIPY